MVADIQIKGASPDFQGLESSGEFLPSLGNVAAAKAELRARLRVERARLTDAERTRAGRAAAEHVGALPAFRAARRVALYLALPRELPTAPLIERCVREGRAMAVPVFDAATGRYRMADFDPGAPLRRGPLGIAEPEAPEWIAPGAIGLWLVPGLAFDARGGRLGRGAGWYDRLLAGDAAPRAGWAFETQLVARIPMGPRDAGMDFVVTEQRIVVCRRTAHAARRAAADETDRGGAPGATQETTK